MRFGHSVLIRHFTSAWVFLGVAVLLCMPSQSYGQMPGPDGLRQKRQQSRARDTGPEKTAPLATPSGTTSGSTQSARNIKELSETQKKAEENLDLENTVYLDLAHGRVVIKLRPDLAPLTVTRFKELVRQGYYDGLTWHRVISGFMAQTGDPRGDGTGGSGQSINAEFNDGKHVRGAISMARSSNINSADSQFFVVLEEAPHLDGQYTYFGEVLDGMQYVDQIRKGDPQSNGSVPYPDRILLMQVAADAEKNDKAADLRAELEAQNKPTEGETTPNGNSPTGG